MSKCKTPLGTLENVTGVTGVVFIAFKPAAGPKGMLGISPEKALETAEALTAAAREAQATAERLGRKAAAVQDALFTTPA